ncbi:hypothetical protein EYF80_024455 [Liparis tanakae]|uniref:Uncharacterized protein n=1 Tax=Liparis tanakae TaxID=230148 RepID=A0A4Z2HI95_9TELE|nr:hypothetical protein EYF80_024455 [Liparis tanakae]
MVKMYRGLAESLPPCNLADISATEPASWATFTSRLSFLLKQENRTFLWPGFSPDTQRQKQIKPLARRRSSRFTKLRIPSTRQGMDLSLSELENSTSSLLTKSLYERDLVDWLYRYSCGETERCSETQQETGRKHRELIGRWGLTSGRL